MRSTFNPIMEAETPSDSAKIYKDSFRVPSMLASSPKRESNADKFGGTGSFHAPSIDQSDKSKVE